jgi:YHS domain-containing protein
MLSSGQVLSVEPTFTALFSNKAIRGYDTVAYFTENKPIKGKAEFSAEYRGAMWMFSSQENLDLFLQDPEKYAPQYGGYCAFAVAKNTTASIKPELFTIHEGKLYLNYSNEINDKWLANKDDYIKRADENGPAILAK